MPIRANYSMVSEDDPQWVRFWSAYPRRCAKKEARRAFGEIDPDVATVDKMVEALEWQSRQPQWTKDGGAFIPYPASWLRAERWDDEMPAHLQPRARRCAYGHEPACDTHGECTQKMLSEQREQRGLRAV